MDAPLHPPHIVVEGRQSCPNAQRAEALLDQALAMASAPTPGWTVLVRVEESPLHALRAEGDIADAAGHSIAHRVLSGGATDCEGLARAMGVWATLVLDLETSPVRPPAEATPVAADSGPPSDKGMTPAPPASSAAGRDLSLAATAVSRRSSSAAPAVGPVASPAAPAPGGGSSPDDAVPRDTSPWPPAVSDNGGASSTLASDSDPLSEASSGRRDDHRTLEIGLGTFLMAGTGANAIVGVTPYVGIELSPGLFVRPALAAGESLVPSGDGDVSAVWFAGRVDGCWRTPGTYPFNRGLQLDLCGGIDAGATRFTTNSGPGTGSNPVTGAHGLPTLLPEVALGPSLDLEGDLGNALSVAIRGIAGVNVIRESYVDTTQVTVKVPFLSGRLEVAFAWRAR